MLICFTFLASTIKKLPYKSSNASFSTELILLSFFTNSASIPNAFCKNKPSSTLTSQNITIHSDIFRYQLQIPKNIITDHEDGDLKDLKSTLKNLDGTAIPLDSWIQYDARQHVTDFFISRALLEKYHQKWLSYKLVATDTDGHSGEVQYNFFFGSKRTVPTYVLKLTLTSILEVVHSSHDVLILFFVQNNKLFPYATTYNQGVPVRNDFVTESLTVNRASGTGDTSISMDYR